LGKSQHSRLLFPLPEGEGQGEGELQTIFSAMKTPAALLTIGFVLLCVALPSPAATPDHYDLSRLLKPLTTKPPQVYPTPALDKDNLRPVFYDGLPYLGAVPGLDNGFVAAGHFRSGLYLSPGTAVVLADLIAGKTPSIDLRPFRVSRG